MTSAMTYGPLNARIRSLRSMLFTQSIFLSMVRSVSLADMLPYFSKTHWEYLTDRFRHATIEQIEDDLLLEEIRQLKHIRIHSKGAVNQLVTLYLERYEVRKLNTLIRLWHRKASYERSFYRNPIIYDYPVEALLEAEKILEVAGILKKTPYSNILIRTAKDYENQQSTFPLEMALSKDRFNRLWQTADLFPKRDRELIYRFTGIECDIINLKWFLRLHQYYHLSSGDAGKLLLEHGYSFSIQQFMDFDLRPELLPFFKDMMTDFRFHSVLKKISESGKQETLLALLEQELYQIQIREANRAFQLFPFSIAAFLGYMILLNLNTRTLAMIIRGKQQGLTPSDIEDRLIG